MGGTSLHTQRVIIWAPEAPKCPRRWNNSRFRFLDLDHSEFGLLCLDMKLRKKRGKKLHDNGYAEDEWWMSQFVIPKGWEYGHHRHPNVQVNTISESNSKFQITMRLGSFALIQNWEKKQEITQKWLCRRWVIKAQVIIPKRSTYGHHRHPNVQVDTITESDS